MTPSRTRSPTDIFNRLYYQGVRSKRRQTISHQQREARRRQNEELTFHPKISSFARKFPRSVSSDGNRFYDEMKRKQQKEVLVLIERERLIREQCPFTPTPKGFSREIFHNQSDDSIPEQIYENVLKRAEKRRERLDALFHEMHPFKPTLSAKALELKKREEAKESQKEKAQETRDNIPSELKLQGDSKTPKTESLRNKKIAKPAKKERKDADDNRSVKPLDVSQKQKDSLSSRNSQPKQKQQNENKALKREQEYTSSSNSSENSRSSLTYPRVETLLNRFKELSNSINSSKNEIGSRGSIPGISEVRSTPHKLTKHYSQLLSKNHQDLSKGSFDIGLII